MRPLPYILQLLPAPPPILHPLLAFLNAPLNALATFGIEARPHTQMIARPCKNWQPGVVLPRSDSVRCLEFVVLSEKIVTIGLGTRSFGTYHLDEESLGFFQHSKNSFLWSTEYTIDCSPSPFRMKTRIDAVPAAAAIILRGMARSLEV